MVLGRHHKGGGEWHPRNIEARADKLHPAHAGAKLQHFSQKWFCMTIIDEPCLAGHLAGTEVLAETTELVGTNALTEHSER